MSHIYRGLLKPKLYFGMDSRVLFAAALCAVGGIFAWQMFIVGGVVALLGVTLGKVSPYMFDELAAYMGWRMRSWDGVFDDESFDAEPDSGMLKSTRRVKG